MKNKKLFFTKILATSLAVLLVSQGLSPVATEATASPIPVAVEVSSFSSSNVSSSASANTLIRTTGSATASSNNLMLTDDLGDQVGTAVRRNRMLLGTTGFSTYFQMRMDQTTSPADGLCFIVYQADTDTTKTGQKGEGVGFLGITSGTDSSIGVEFDTYTNSNRGDPNGGHVAIDTDGSVTHTSSLSAASTSTSSAAPTDDGTSNIAHSYDYLNNTLVNVWVDYDGATGYITVTYGTNATRTNSSNYSFKRNVGTSLVGKYVYVGFSASTGGSQEKHEVLKWYFSNNYTAGGLQSAANSYTQGASTAGVTLNQTTDPSTANIVFYDAVGTAKTGEDFYISIDGTRMGSTNTTGSSGFDYTIPSSLSAGTHTLTVQSVDGGVVKSAVFTVSPNPATIDSNPLDSSVIAGTSASFAVSATPPSGGVLSYKWQVSSNNGGSYSNISGANSASYTVNSATAADNGKLFRCVITNTQASLTKDITSQAGKLTVTPKTTSLSRPTITLTDKTVTPVKYTITTSLSNFWGTISGNTISFYDGSTLIGSASTDATGLASLLYTGLTPGEHVIKAAYAGNADNSAAQTLTTTLTVASETPGTPSLNGISDGKTYTGSWTSKDITITASGSESVSGIARYEYRLGTAGDWSTMPDQSGAKDSVTDKVLSDRITITANIDSTLYVRAVSETGLISEIAQIPVKKDSVIPVLHVAVTGTTGEWTSTPVSFTLSNQTGTASGVTYWVKAGSGEYQAVTGNVFTISTATNTSYVFKAVSGAGLTGEVSGSYMVKLSTETLKEVNNRIDGLPDPVKATDTEILGHETDIKDTKVLYDTLSKDDKKNVGTERTDKLNLLLNRLDSLLQIIGKDTKTGVFSDNIGTAVQIPELNQAGIGKVLLKLIAEPVKSTDSGFANIAIAQNALDGVGQTILSSFDMGIFKTVFDHDGAQVSTGKVANTDITGTVTIRVPVPAGYEHQKNLQVVYIDDQGKVTPLTTTYVTEGDASYLEFSTTHFSVYAIVLAKDTDVAMGDLGTPVYFGVIALTAAVFMVAFRKRRIAQ